MPTLILLITALVLPSTHYMNIKLVTADMIRIWTFSLDSIWVSIVNLWRPGP